MKWQAEDFKGLADGRLEFEPGTLTVLAGANSSGKSSLVQSVLMTAQSLHHNGPIVLNGPLARLGEAKDLVRDSASTTRLTLSVGTPKESGWGEDPLRQVDDAASADPAGISAQFELKSTSDGGSLALHRVRISSDTGGQNQLLLSKENSRSEDVAAVSRIIGVGGLDVLHVKSLLGSPRRQLRTYIAFRGIVPIALVRIANSEIINSEFSVQFTAAIKTVRRALDASRGLQARRSLGDELYLLEEEMRRASISLRESPESDNELNQTLREVSRRGRWDFAKLSMLSPDRLTDFVKAMAELRAEKDHVLISIEPGGISSRLFPSGYGVLERSLADNLKESIAATASLRAGLEKLSAQVQYLGPLRDEPRVVWNQWNEQARGLPVGARGEFSAALLSRRALQPVEYVTPDGISARGSLNEAVNEWLVHLDIGESVSTTSRGKLGVGVEVYVQGQARDLTSVGVGVSQALPLIVAFLTVPRGSIFLVEQPELHLHPAVQARLADFLLMARPDVSAIVETHSEALLTRVRRRVAEGRVHPARVKVIFVENEGSGSRTRELVLSQYGDLSEWPRGFISGSAEDAQAIVRANLGRLR